MAEKTLFSVFILLIISFLGFNQLFFDHWTFSFDNRVIDFA